MVQSLGVRSVVVVVLAAGCAVLEFMLIVPDDGESGGLAYIAALLLTVATLTYASKGELWPPILGALPASVFMFLMNLGGDNDGLQLLIVPWIFVVALLQIFAAAAGRRLWQRLGRDRHS